MADKRKDGMISGAAGGAVAAAIAAGGKVKSPRFAIAAAVGAGLGAYLGPKIMAEVEDARARPAPTPSPHPERVYRAPSDGFGDLGQIDGSTWAGAIGGAAAGAVAAGGKVKSPRGALLVGGGAFLGALVAPELFGGEAQAAEAEPEPAAADPEWRRGDEVDADKLGRGLYTIGGAIAANEVMRISGIGNRTVGGRLGRYGAAMLIGSAVSDMVMGGEAQAAEPQPAAVESEAPSVAPAVAAMLGGTAGVALVARQASRHMNREIAHLDARAAVRASSEAAVSGKTVAQLRETARGMGVARAGSLSKPNLQHSIRLRLTEQGTAKLAKPVTPAWVAKPGRIGLAMAGAALVGSVAAGGATAYLTSGAREQAAEAPAPAQRSGGAGSAGGAGGRVAYTTKDGRTVRLTAAQAAAARARRK